MQFLIVGNGLETGTPVYRFWGAHFFGEGGGKGVQNPILGNIQKPNQLVHSLWYLI